MVEKVVMIRSNLDKDFTIQLRSLENSDVPSLFTALCDKPEVWSWSPYSIPNSENQMKEIVGKILDDVLAGTREAFAIFIKSTGEVVGTTSFLNVGLDDSSIEIGGTLISSNYWRTGINRQAKALMLSESFEFRNLERVYFKTDILNLRSIEALNRLGAIEEGVLRHERKRKDGSWRDSVYFSILSSEWPGIRDRLTMQFIERQELQKLDNER